MRYNITISRIANMIKNGLCVSEMAQELGLKESSIRRNVRRINENKKNPQEITKKLPKILLFDIETSPMEVLVWGLYKQRIPHNNIIKEWSVLSWAAKWLFNNEVISEVVTPNEAKARTDKSVIKGIWNLIEEADIIIAHNAESFDIRKLNARFSANDLLPPSPYRVIDTLKVSRKNFAFSSHKLDHLTKMLGVRGKIETEYGLWKRCIGMTTDVEGQKKALEEMETYNKSDVFALEDLYVELRPWIKSHPNVGLYADEITECCANCGSSNIKLCGHYYTPAGKFEAHRCECGAIGRSRYSAIDGEQRKNLTVSVAR